MESAPIPENEANRLRALRELCILDTPSEETFDRISRVAARALNSPISLVSLVDEDREWFKSSYGTNQREGDRRVAFCAHTILEDRALVIADTLEDPRFADNPQVTEHGIRFYAGVPLQTTSGHNVGVLCLKGYRPRRLTDSEVACLEDLAAIAARELEMRLAAKALDQANQALSQKAQDLDEFTFVAAHDLQEPLRKLVAFSELLEIDLGDDLGDAARGDLEFIIQAAERMRNLIQDLLALSRAGRIDGSLDHVSLEECLDSALDALSIRFEETGAELEREPLPEVIGHRTGLTQLLQNLVSNSLKFRDPSRPLEIRITAERVDDQWLLGVRDNGIGIKPAYAEQVFAPFKRLHNREDYEGTGIGLAICRKTVQRHGGKIWVEPVQGTGSWFRFCLDASLHPVPSSESIPETRSEVVVS